MPKTFRFATPDQRMRRLEGQTQREVERKQELDLFEQRRRQEIQNQMETEKARGAELDLGQEMQFETERARGLDLDERLGQPTATPTPTPRSRVEQSLTAGRSPLLDIAKEDIARQRE
ncbi:hypothetical protein LCGC14_2484860, partial [marine sediment metagenome]